MNQSIIKIADLSNFSNSELKKVTIKASVSIRSLRHGNSRHAHFYMDLRDDSGDITAVAYTHNELGDDQLHIIQDNRTYMITNISLENSNKRYTSIPNEKEIVLNEESVIKLSSNAPKVEWPLTPLNEVYDHETPKLFNIVGLCTKVTEIEVVHGEITRKVTLMDEARSEVVLNVWNQETLLFDELDLKFHPVFFVKDARIYKYRGTTSLSTSRYLQLLDPGDPRAAKIRTAMKGNPPEQVEGYPYCTPSNYTKQNRKYMTIGDLNGYNNAYDVTIIATVTVKSIGITDVRKDIRFQVDLCDDSGEIVAVVRGDSCAKLHNFIQTNKTYSFTRFSVCESDDLHTSIPHQWMLLLDNDSIVKLCGTAPQVEWPLSPLTVVKAKDTKMFHAFGLCMSIQGRVVNLVDQLGRELLLEVGDEYIAMFDALDLGSRPVFFVKDAKMSDKKYKGSTILKTGPYLELLEPDDPRAGRVMSLLCDGTFYICHRYS